MVRKIAVYAGAYAIGAMLISCILLAALAVVTPRKQFQFTCEQTEANIWDCRWIRRY